MLLWTTKTKALQNRNVAGVSRYRQRFSIYHNIRLIPSLLSMGAQLVIGRGAAWRKFGLIGLPIRNPIKKRQNALQISILAFFYLPNMCCLQLVFFCFRLYVPAHIVVQIVFGYGRRRRRSVFWLLFLYGWLLTLLIVGVIIRLFVVAP